MELSKYESLPNDVAAIKLTRVIQFQQQINRLQPFTQG